MKRNVTCPQTRDGNIAISGDAAFLAVTRNEGGFTLVHCLRNKSIPDVFATSYRINHLSYDKNNTVLVFVDRTGTAGRIDLRFRSEQRSGRIGERRVEGMEQCWSRFGSSNAMEAEDALVQMKCLPPGRAVQFLRENASAVSRVTEERVADLIRALNSEEFTIRKHAKYLHTQPTVIQAGPWRGTGPETDQGTRAPARCTGRECMCNTG